MYAIVVVVGVHPYTLYQHSYTIYKQPSQHSIVQQGYNF
jgi:hypothetical protein